MTGAGASDPKGSSAGSAGGPVSPVDDVQKLVLKVFLADDAAGVDPQDLVPVFHRWIQSRALDQLLIDVADYRHVGEGPQVVLVAHEGQLAWDSTGGRVGLQYSRTKALAGTLPQRLEGLCRELLQAACLLETDAALAGRLRFSGHVLQVVANDRLRAPNTPAAADALEAALAPLLARLHPGTPATIVREEDLRERLTLLVNFANPNASVPLETLAARLADET